MLEDLAILAKLNALTPNGMQSVLSYSASRLRAALCIQAVVPMPEEYMGTYHDHLKEELFAYSFLLGSVMLLHPNPKDLTISKIATTASLLYIRGTLVDREELRRIANTYGSAGDHILVHYEGEWWEKMDEPVQAIYPRDVFGWWEVQKHRIAPVFPRVRNVINLAEMKIEQLDQARDLAVSSVELMDSQLATSAERIATLTRRLNNAKRLRGELKGLLADKEDMTIRLEKLHIRSMTEELPANLTGDLTEDLIRPLEPQVVRGEQTARNKHDRKQKRKGSVNEADSVKKPKTVSFQDDLATKINAAAEAQVAEEEEDEQAAVEAGSGEEDSSEGDDDGGEDDSDDDQ
ncbi:hypothetical protein DFP72DRAFT_1074861 [Ephemerocybe angulata]|uniref:Uncharacterized protein n=1 Tax=Ephemerocybe angulata TaxID=980116 RepID=A0A8H6HKD7_9AGAR|nr:hypothetical protein DFP72DRAFT_1076683 [Tulosesus angulatus]KAF6747985.1 hypothetical protein DFP72DRAFT_1074861 [Tulosesus angulatus]